MPYVLMIVVFAGTALGAYGVLDLFFSEDRHVSRRLQELSEYERHEVKAAQPLLAPFADRVFKPLFAGAVALARRLSPVGYASRVRARLARAGFPRGIGIERMMFAKTVAALAGLGCTFAWGALRGWSAGPFIVWMALFGALGFYAPDLWLVRQTARRQHRIALELPDMLDMLTISVEAGLGFDAALVKLVKNQTGPLAEEFGRVLQEVQAGSSRKEALRSMAERLDVPELSSFTASIVQADMFGVSIAQILRTQAADMRVKRRQRAEEQAQKAPVKMVVPLVVCILPATIIVVGGPAMVRIAEVFGM